MMNFGLPTSKWQCSPDMKFYQSSGFTRKRNNNIDVKCYRCEQIDHFRKQCNSNTKKQKSEKNIARDKSRLRLYKYENMFELSVLSFKRFTILEKNCV